MKNKNWILPGLIAVIVAAGFLAIGFSSHASAQKQKDGSTCCRQQKEKDCNGKSGSSSQEILIPENLSRQFLSLINFDY